MWTINFDQYGYSIEVVECPNGPYASENEAWKDADRLDSNNRFMHS